MAERKKIRFKDAMMNLPIKQELWLKKKSQRWLANKTKIREPILSQIINGRIIPTSEERAAIAKVLKKTEDFLFA